MLNAFVIQIVYKFSPDGQVLTHISRRNLQLFFYFLKQLSLAAWPLFWSLFNLIFLKLAENKFNLSLNPFAVRSSLTTDHAILLSTDLNLRTKRGFKISSAKLTFCIHAKKWEKE